mgnify:CR=1 FL=1|jgi:hypothetical protein|tara:strand:- start:18810 stop:19745 length:936 start_codon:yes stop_codon:yes gene_type:complete
MKIFCHVPRENWIVDRMGIEFKNHSKHDVSFEKIENDTDIIWLLGSWCWNQIPINVLERFKVVCTIHHEVPWKFDEKRKQNFLDRDKIVDYYLTYTESTKDLIQSISNKPVKLISHWVNTSIWNKIDKNESRKDLGIPEDRFLIGSFQRDTEGFDLKTPKLEKGPDIFVKKVIEIAKVKNKVHVILAGWRRQYVIAELEKNNIDYTYFELPDIDILNKLYNALDLYIVSARCEGGPQAIFECGYLEIPVLTTEVGQHHLLDENCKFREEEKIDVNKIKLAYDSISKNKKNIDMLIDIKHISKYDEFLESIK